MNAIRKHTGWQQQSIAIVQVAELGKQLGISLAEGVVEHIAR
jgi:hypothetical protein